MGLGGVVGAGDSGLARADTCSQRPHGLDPSLGLAPHTEIFLLPQIFTKRCVCKMGGKRRQVDQGTGTPEREGSFGNDR